MAASPGGTRRAFRLSLEDADVTDESWAQLLMSIREAEPLRAQSTASLEAQRATGNVTCPSTQRSAGATTRRSASHGAILREGDVRPLSPRPPPPRLLSLPTFSEILSDGADGPEGALARTRSGMRMQVEAIDAAAHGDARPQWGSKVEYMLSVIGFAVGLGNVWRFPKLVMENGGGAFLIPYACMLVILGLPLFVLEIGVGQMFQQQAARLWPSVDARLRGVGWASAAVAYMNSFSYNVVIAWSLLYLIESFKVPLPWTVQENHEIRPCMAGAATENAAQVFWESCATRQLDLTDPGWESVNLSLLACLAAAWGMCYLFLRNGIESSGKVVLVTATFPYVVLLILLVRGATLEGAADGVRYFLSPDFEKLKDIRVWLRAANQIFYSLGPGFGTHIGYSSYNPKETRFVSDAVTVAVVNSGTSILAGFVVFSIAGYLAHIRGVAVRDLAIGGPGLAFIAYPTAVALLPGAQIFAALFFLMMLSLGIDSQMGTVEVFATAIVDAVEAASLRRTRRGARHAGQDDDGTRGPAGVAGDGPVTGTSTKKHTSRDMFEEGQCPAACIPRPAADAAEMGERRHRIIGAVCICGFAAGILCVTRGGVAIVDVIDYFAALYSLFLICALEVVGVVFCFGTDRFSAEVELHTGRPLPRALLLVWRFFSAPMCLVLAGLSLAAAAQPDYLGNGVPAWAYGLGWTLANVPVVIIVLGAVSACLQSQSAKKDPGVQL